MSTLVESARGRWGPAAAAVSAIPHGLIDGRRSWRSELQRIVLPMLGKAETLERPEGEREWMVVDSFCQQHLWGSWSGGYYGKATTELPPPSASWPLRTAIATGCPLVTLP